LSDGREVPFDGCVIATGASPRRLPDQPSGWKGLHELRTLDDALTLRDDLHGHGPRRVVVIGAGFIGAEVAATARKLGHEVTVLEALSAPLVRGLGEVMGNAIGAVHTANGVDLRCNVGVAGFAGNGTVSGVVLADGTTVPADVVVVGVGVAPNTAWLEQADVLLDNGIVCDAFLRAAPRVYAAGDVARWPYNGDGPLTRIEHWSNANEQGSHAAANVLAEADGQEPTPFLTQPFVWSDQYDRRIQVLGRVSGDHEITVVHGSVAEGAFVTLYGSGGRLMGVLGVNQPKKVAGYRKLLASAASWEDALTHAREVEAAGR
jgi:NADPH-dependent 2,4-dienoyl-CoA reductase/sulfur reductase-like enzyme